MNATALIFGAVAAVAPIAKPYPLAAQARTTTPVIPINTVAWWQPSTFPTVVTSGLVKVAVNPPQSEWNAAALWRASTATPWQLSYYALHTIKLGTVPFMTLKKPGPTTTLAADARVRIHGDAVLVESPVGIMTPPPTTTVASVTQQSGSAVSMGNFESTIVSVLSGLDSIVNSIPSLRELGRAVSETNTRTVPVTEAQLASGQVVFLDGGRRLVIIADRLVLMTGTQNQRTWPAATTWLLKTGDQFISVLERIGYTK